MASRLSSARILGLACIAVLPLLAACEDEVLAPDDEQHLEGTLAIDASSPTDFVYLSLTGEGTVV